MAQDLDTPILRAMRGMKALTSSDFTPRRQASPPAEFAAVPDITLDASERIAVVQVIAIIILVITLSIDGIHPYFFASGMALLSTANLYDFILLIRYQKELNIITKLCTIVLALGLIGRGVSHVASGGNDR